MNESVTDIAARISMKALNAAKTQDELAKGEKAQEEEIQRQRRERLKAWRNSKAPTEDSSPAIDPTKEPCTSRDKSDILTATIKSPSTKTLLPGNNSLMSIAMTMTKTSKSIATSKKSSAEGLLKIPAAFGKIDDPVETDESDHNLTDGKQEAGPNPVPFSIEKDEHHADVLPNDRDDNSDYDPLDAFMSSLYDTGDVTEQFEDESSSISNHKKSASINPNGTNFITLEQINKVGHKRQKKKDTDTDSVVSKTYDPADWKSDVAFSPAPSQDDEKEEIERRQFLEALRDSELPRSSGAVVASNFTEEIGNGEVKSDNDGELGRVFAGEGDMIEESEVEAKKKSALDILEEQRRGKELRPVDHSSIDYIPFRKNLYTVPRVLANLSPDELRHKRDVLQLKVRGRGCPAPVDSWDQCGLSERMLSLIKKQNFETPFSIQKQALPAIMCGRDIIAVAKTGSGKTLAFLLPMFRHIIAQPALRDSEGPIGLIMAPARELAYQIYNEAKKFTKALGLRVACVYGGAGVADQIADLKRGADIVVCTPGRMIDILCMQAGKLVTLKRVTMVVMDEADRMFDMGFEPQIKMILQNVRPDRQTVLFSATFPKQIEKLAKNVLQYPLEIVVGERSTVNKDITQVVEVHEPEDKYMRLLQLLGIWYERGSVLIFVDKQETCDQLFQDLLKSGYPCVSLHGGKDQLDRDHTLHEFKSGVKTVMVATSVAGRGLDVPEIVCVINYNCPNHMEDYVHRVGRTGRAGRKGTAYTFVTPSEEQHAPTMLAVLEKAGISGEDVPIELRQMADSFRDKVKRGEAKWSSNGFSGSKGFSFDSSEMNEAQKLASMQRRAYEIEQGIITEKNEEEDLCDQEGDEEEGLSLAVQPANMLQDDISNMATSEEVRPESATGLEKARALAVSMGMNPASTNSASTPILPAMTTDGKVDTMAALLRAKLIAQQMAGGVPGADDLENKAHYAEELEINDYPANVRRKVTMRSTLDEVTDRTATNIISRGSYVAPGKKLEIGERKLYLLIEGPSEMQVKQARLEVIRLLEEETLRQGASSFSGRYTVT